VADRIERPEPNGGGPLASVPARAVVVVIVAAVLTGSGLVLDGVVGPKGPGRAVPSAGASGVLFCPHGGQSGWEGWVVVTNPGPGRVRVRLTELGDEGKRSVTTFGVGAERQVYRQVSADGPADATEVEYFGGWVGAAAILATNGSGGIAAERCEPATHRNSFVLDLPTGSDQSSYLVVMNPFDEAAEFDVRLRTEQREVAAGALTPYVLPPQHSVGIPIDRYLLLGPGEQSLTAQVTQRMGRVVAGGFEVSAAGIRSEVATPAPQTSWVIPAGGDSGTRQLVVLNTGDSRADLSAVAEGPSAQRLVSGRPEGLTVGPGEVKTFSPERMKDAGLLVDSTNGRPILVAVRLTGPRGDSAIVSGTSTTARRWLVLPTLPPVEGRSIVLVQNPGRSRVEVSFRLIASEGSAASIRSRSIPPGRTIKVVLPNRAGRPVSAVVTARGGTIVAAIASYFSNRVGYAATLGLPMN
jgi:hypothetical protein